jgi:probable F420-dependent oxidoreductase
VPRIDLGPDGAVVSPDTEGFVELAVELERMDFSTIWITGGPMAHLGQVAEVVQATTTAKIATAIISVDRFPAADVAELYAELEASAPGRFVVGLGGAHGADPLGTLNAYLDALESVPVSARVLAALGPRMLGLARDRAAGALPVLITPDYTREARRIVGDDTALAVEQLVVVEREPDRARRIAHGPLDFLGRLPGYQASFRRQGFSADEVEALTDTVVDGLIAWGDGSAVAQRVRALKDAGADHVAVSVVSEGPPPLEQWRAVAAALGHER